MTANSVGRNIVATAIANFAVPAVGLATAPLLAHALGVTGRGELAAIMAPYTFVIAIATVGVPEAITHHVAGRPGAGRSIVKAGTWQTLAVSAVATVFTIALIGAVVVEDSTVRTLMLFSCLGIVPMSFVYLGRATAAGLHRWDLVNLDKYVSSGLRLSMLALFAWLGVLSVGVAATVMVVTPIIGGLMYLRAVNTVRSATEVMSEAPRDILSFSSRVWAGSLSGIVLGRLDQILMIPLAGAFQLGLYAAAVSVSEAVLVINSAVRDVLFSAESSSVSRARLFRWSRVSFIMSLLLSVPLVLSMPTWFPFLFGTEFGEATGVAILLTIAVVGGVPGSIAGAGLGAWGSPGLRSWGMVAAAAINVVLVVVLAPPFGAMGAAVATLIGNFVAANMNIYFLRSRFSCKFSDFYLPRRSDLAYLIGSSRMLLNYR